MDPGAAGRHLDIALAHGIQDMEAGLVRRHVDRSLVHDWSTLTGELAGGMFQPRAGAAKVVAGWFERLEEEAGRVDAGSLGPARSARKWGFPHTLPGERIGERRP